MTSAFTEKAADGRARERMAAERFARWHRRPEAKSIAARYGDWSRTDLGVAVMASLGSVTVAFVGGRLSRAQYRLGLRSVAESAHVPLRDVQVMAKGLAMQLRCALHGSVESDRTNWGRP